MRRAVIAGLLLLCCVQVRLPAAPASQAYRWRNVAIGGGGYVLDVYCHPGQRDLVYIRTDVGGFYRWNSALPGWTPLTDMFDAGRSNYYGGEGLALDPSDPRTVYIAAGKYEWAGPGTVFKSRDQGRSWVKLPIDVPMGGNEDHRWDGQRLVVNPLRPSTLLLGTRKNGLWRSTDAGASWARVPSFPGTGQPGAGINAIAFSPIEPGAAYASCFGDGVYVSRDDGSTWARTKAGPGDVSRLACASDGTLYASRSRGVARYDGVWKDISPQGAAERFCGIATDPNDPAGVLAATNAAKLDLFRSTDRGASWTCEKIAVTGTPQWYSSSMRQIQYAAGLAFDPCVRGRIWVTDWYAAYHASADVSPVNLTATERGHEELVAFDLLAPPSGPVLLSGVADVDGFVHSSLEDFPVGLGSYYGGRGPSFGDTTQIALCLSQPSRLARASSNRWDKTGLVTLSDDGGYSWRPASGWGDRAKPQRLAVSCADPDDIVVACMGGGPALVTRDGGKTWREAAGLPDPLMRGDVWNWQFPLASDGANGEAFYVFDDGAVFRSVDGGATFLRSDALVPRSVQAVVTAPGRPGEVWLCAGTSGLYRSRDGARTFLPVKSISAADLFAVGKAARAGDPPALYLRGAPAGGREGIYQSVDDGATWREISDPRVPVGDDPNCMAASLRTFGLVFIGTNGRGVYYGEPLDTERNALGK